MTAPARYGQKGGDGPTRGRRAETLRDPVSGLTKRVFFGQRYLLVQQADEASKPLVRAYHSREAAETQLRRDRRFNLTVEYVSRAQ